MYVCDRCVKTAIKKKSGGQSCALVQTKIQILKGILSFLIADCFSNFLRQS